MGKKDTSKIAAEMIANAKKYGIPLKKKPKRKN